MQELSISNKISISSRCLPLPAAIPLCNWMVPAKQIHLWWSFWIWLYLYERCCSVCGWTSYDWKSMLLGVLMINAVKQVAVFFSFFWGGSARPVRRHVATWEEKSLCFVLCCKHVATRCSYFLFRMPCNFLSHGHACSCWALVKSQNTQKFGYCRNLH